MDFAAVIGLIGSFVTFEDAQVKFENAPVDVLVKLKNAPVNEDGEIFR